MKRIRIYLYKHPSDMMKDLTICRNCGRPEEYGKMVNNTGHDACPKCYESLRLRIKDLRENDYDTYRDIDHCYIMSDEDYNKRCKELLDRQKEFIKDQEDNLNEKKT